MAANAIAAIRETARKVNVLESRSEYRYDRIDHHRQIRLLELLPDSPQTVIKCILWPYSESHQDSSGSASNIAPNGYRALSYFWGTDLPPRHKILIFNNQTELKKYYEHVGRKTIAKLQKVPYQPNPPYDEPTQFIQSNLYEALQQLRPGANESSMWLWVDALCIDQGHIPERSAQVARMHDVYMGAASVCVWLGPEEPGDEAERTFTFLTSILNLEDLDEFVQGDSKKEEWKLVLKAMRKSWFSRRWVIQELALARNASVQLGRYEVEWSKFADATALFMTKYKEIKKLIGTPETFNDTADNSVEGLDAHALSAHRMVDATTNLFRKSEDGSVQYRLLTLEALVSSWLLAFEAKDPRDTVFAILNIAKDTSLLDAGTLRQPTWWIAPTTSAVLACTAAVWVAAVDWYQFIERWTLFISPSSTRVILLFIAASIITTIGSPLNIYTCLKMLARLSHHGHTTLDERLKADYGKCLTDVYAGFMEYCIETSQSLDILCRHWATLPKNMTQLDILNRDRTPSWEDGPLPSWISDITGSAFGDKRAGMSVRTNGDSFVGSMERQNHYNASAGLEPEVKFHKLSAFRLPLNILSPTHSTPSEPEENIPPVPRCFTGTLSIIGFQLATINLLSKPAYHSTIPLEALQMGGWRRDQTNEQRVPDQLWRTLVANRGPDGINPPGWYRRACESCLIWTDRQWFGDFCIDGLKKIRGIPSTMVKFAERVEQVAWNRSFFLATATLPTTKKEPSTPFFGLGPSDAITGDLICIFFGCSVPVVLRRIQNQGIFKSEEFRFIGECYVHGMMDGEAIPNPARPPRARTFILK